MTLDILPDGTVRHLHSESPLVRQVDAALGGPLLNVQRASEIEFNLDTLQWEVRPVSDPHTLLFAHASRAACLAWEDEHMLAHFAATHPTPAMSPRLVLLLAALAGTILGTVAFFILF